MNYNDTFSKACARRKRKLGDITFDTCISFENYELSIQNRPNLGAYTSSLRKIYSQLRSLQSHHCKVFVCRIDLHVNERNWSEGDLAKMLKNVKKNLRSKYKTYRIGHVWAREKCKSGKTHFHLTLFLDGNKVRKSKPINDIVSLHWKKRGHPSTHHSSSHMLSNEVDDAFRGAFYHLSYLSKVYTKDGQPPRRRNFGVSTVRHNPSKLFGAR